jgi:hypothetical protein
MNQLGVNYYDITYEEFNPDADDEADASVASVRTENVRTANVRTSNVRTANVRTANVRTANVRTANVRTLKNLQYLADFLKPGSVVDETTLHAKTLRVGHYHQKETGKSYICIFVYVLNPSLYMCICVYMH